MSHNTSFNSFPIFDLLEIDTKTKIHYETFRRGGVGYWAHVPRELIPQLPAQSILVTGLGNYDVIQHYNKGRITLVNYETSQETTISVSDCKEVCEVFVLEKNYSAKGFLQFRAELMYITLLVLPAVLLYVVGGISTESIYARFATSILSVLLMFVLIIYKVSGTKHLSIICGLKQTCSNSLQKITFKRVTVSPALLGVAYSVFVLIVMSLNYGGLALLIVNGVVISVNFYLIAFRWKVKGLDCALCNFSSALITAMAIISTLAGKGSLLKSINELYSFIFIGVFAMLFTQIVFYFIGLSEMLNQKASQLKLYTSNSAVYNHLAEISTEHSELKYEDILDKQKFTIFEDRENIEDQNRKVLHIVLGLSCKHCKNKLKEIISSIERLSVNRIEVSFSSSFSSFPEIEVIVSRLQNTREVEESFTILSETYLNGVTSVHIDEPDEGGQYLVNTESVPIIFIDGRRVSNVFSTEDISFHLLYS